MFNPIFTTLLNADTPAIPICRPLKLKRQGCWRFTLRVHSNEKAHLYVLKNYIEQRTIQFYEIFSDFSFNATVLTNPVVNSLAKQKEDWEVMGPWSENPFPHKAWQPFENPCCVYNLNSVDQSCGESPPG